MRKAWGVAIAVGLVALAAGAYGYGYRVWWADRQMQADMQARVREHLNDPDSAQFRNTFVGRKDGVICGEVNAKNRMGGYVGYTAFILFPDNDLRFDPAKTERDDREGAQKAALFADMWQGFCGRGF